MKFVKEGHTLGVLRQPKRTQPTPPQIQACKPCLSKAATAFRATASTSLVEGEVIRIFRIVVVAMCDLRKNVLQGIYDKASDPLRVAA